LVNNSRTALGLAPITWSTALPGDKPKGAAAGSPTRPTSAASVAATPGGRAGKASGAAGAAPGDVASAVDPAADRSARVKQAQTLVRSTLLLAEVESARWRPQRGLNLALEALVQWQDLAGAAGGLSGTNEEVDRHRLGPAAWLRARLQVSPTDTRCHVNMRVVLRLRGLHKALQIVVCMEPPCCDAPLHN